VTNFWTNWCGLEYLYEDAFFLFQFFLIAIFGYMNLWMDYITNLQKETLILGGALLRSYFFQQNL
jgi:hypothetical protein